MNYEPDCADCPCKQECKEKNDCQLMRELRHGHEKRGGSGWDNVDHLSEKFATLSGSGRAR
jgi:hypothetical protein